MKTHYDVIVIGSGPGGLAAAVEAKKRGAADVLIVERAPEPGGILLQCIHNGFGVELFKQDWPGPRYAQHFIDQAYALGVEMLLDAMVMDVTADHRVIVSGMRCGYVELQGRAVVLAMGCRERTRPQIGLPGARPAGVYTAGTAQRFVNMQGYMPGRRFVILGSGDIGMIMARRLTLEGARVERVLEIMPYLTGLTRNFVQCLQDFGIPLQLQRTVGRVIGRDRVEAVETVAVDECRQPISGSEEIIPCDTLLLSVGLIPENELSKKAGVRLDPLIGGPVVDERMHTGTPGIFAAGNVVHVYDLVDWVTKAGMIAGRSAADWAQGLWPAGERLIPTQAGENVRYVAPQYVSADALSRGEVQLQMRVTRPIEQSVWVEAVAGRQTAARHGERYARPGEMVTLTLPARAHEALQQADALTVHVRPRSKEGLD